MKIATVLSFAFAATASAFAPQTASFAVRTQHQQIVGTPFVLAAQAEKAEGCSEAVESNDTNASSLDRTLAATSMAGVFWALSSSMAGAAGPDWGLFEGKTGSLLHPVMMFALVGGSVYTALLGFQWRRQRTIGDEIKALKKEMPSFSGSSLSEAIAEAKSAESVDIALVASLEKALPLQAQLDELDAERKELVALGPRDKHFNNGALIAFLGTSFAIEVRPTQFDTTRLHFIRSSIPIGCLHLMSTVEMKAREGRVASFSCLLSICSLLAPYCRRYFVGIDRICRALVSTHISLYTPACLTVSSHFPTVANDTTCHSQTIITTMTIALVIPTGTTKHVRPCREAFPRPAPVRGCRSRRCVGCCCRHRPLHAKGQR